MHDNETCPQCGKVLTDTRIQPAAFPLIIRVDCCSQQCADKELESCTTEPMRLAA